MTNSSSGNLATDLNQFKTKMLFLQKICFSRANYDEIDVLLQQQNLMIFYILTEE